MRNVAILAGALSAAVAGGCAGVCENAMQPPVGEATAILQHAIDTEPKVVLGAGDWVTDPLFVRRGNLEIVLKDGARLLARRGGYHGRNDELLCIDYGAHDIVVRGEGSASFEMPIRDYQDMSKYTFSEWRHTMRIWHATNVVVRGIRFVGSGGDGIAVSGTVNLMVEDCAFVDCNRLGVGVVDCDGLVMRRSVFEANAGTPPRCGIDFESNFESEHLENVLVEDCVFKGNPACGMLFHLAALGPKSRPVSFTVRNCRSIGNGQAGFQVTAAGEKGPIRGWMKFENCVSEGNGGPDFVLNGEDKKNGLRIDITGCNFKNVSVTPYEPSADAAPFRMRAVKPLKTDSGKVTTGWLRGGFNFVQYVPKAGKYRIRLVTRELDGRPPEGTMTVTDHAGTPLGTVKLGKEPVEYEFTSRIENRYLIVGKMVTGLVAIESDIPGAGFKADKAVRLFADGRRREYAFKVPKDCELVRIQVTPQEPCSAELIDASGKVVATKPYDSKKQIVSAKRAKTAADEVWRIAFPRVAEDMFFRIGAPCFPYAEIVK